jgi:hypothetical protein
VVLCIVNRIIRVWNIKLKQVSNVIETWLSENCGGSRYMTPAKGETAGWVENEEVLGGWRQNS